MENIEWTVYGKIREIEKGDGTVLTFAYDPMGKRIMKKVDPTSGNTVYTYYLRDAQGNNMATYERIETATTDEVFLTEQYVYGSSRVGYVSLNYEMVDATPSTTNFVRKLGEKRYELSNHLGNVLAVVTDRLFSYQEASPYANHVKYYEADVVAAQDYDPFGMMLSGRNWTSGSAEEYRFGFNGAEQDKEVYGVGNVYDYGFRIYNPRLGKFLSIDPLFQSFPWYSPYHFAGNNPILNVDLDGMESVNTQEPTKQDDGGVPSNGNTGWISNGYYTDQQTGSKIQAGNPVPAPDGADGGVPLNETTLWFQGVAKEGTDVNDPTFTSDEIEPMNEYYISNAKKYPNEDDCITCLNKAMVILLNDPDIKTSNLGTQITKLNYNIPNGTMEQLQVNGKAGIRHDISVQNGVTTESVGNTVLETANANGVGTSVFGISLLAGYHSAIITVDNSDPNNLAYTFNDQTNWYGSGGAGTKPGIAKFGSAAELDKFINQYISRFSPFVAGRAKTISLWSITH